MNDLEIILIWGLAGWRIANLFINEDGPFQVFDKFRQFIGIKPGPIEGFWPRLFSCIFCLSIWSVGIVALLWEFSEIAVIILAGAAIALIVDRLVNKSS